ncbi:MAG: metal-dependent hydrolase [bacterium]|nr:metal-dependent hydrolase [bacterium]
MPYPLGHTVVGLATAGVVKGLSQKRERFYNWKEILYIIILANLPDIDVLVGLMVCGNGWAFHRGGTHSLVFALIMGGLAANSRKLWKVLPEVNFWCGFSVIFSHIAADMLFTHLPVSFLWPFEIYISNKYWGWQDVLGSVFF